MPTRVVHARALTGGTAPSSELEFPWSRGPYAYGPTTEREASRVLFVSSGYLEHFQEFEYAPDAIQAATSQELFGIRSGETALSWIRTWSEQILKNLVRVELANVIPGTEVEVFADFRPPPAMRIEATVRSIRRIEPDLALTDADWEAMGSGAS